MAHISYQDLLLNKSIQFRKNCRKNVSPRSLSSTYEILSCKVVQNSGRVPLRPAMFPTPKGTHIWVYCLNLDGAGSTSTSLIFDYMNDYRRWIILPWADNSSKFVSWKEISDSGGEFFATSFFSGCKLIINSAGIQHVSHCQSEDWVEGKVSTGRRGRDRSSESRYIRRGGNDGVGVSRKDDTWILDDISVKKADTTPIGIKRQKNENLHDSSWSKKVSYDARREQVLVIGAKNHHCGKWVFRIYQSPYKTTEKFPTAHIWRTNF